MHRRAAPGIIRDSIISYLAGAENASIQEIQEAVTARLGSISPSSVRSYLNLNTPDIFQRTARGRSEAPMPMIELATTWVVETGAPASEAARMTPAEVSCESSACSGRTL